MKFVAAAMISFGSCLTLCVLNSCSTNGPSRDFFTACKDTTWFDDSNYWWIDTVPINADWSGIARYRIVIHGDYVNLESQVYRRDSALFVGSDPRVEFSRMVDFKSPYCIVEDDQQRLVFIEKVDSLVEITHSDPNAHLMFWSYSFTEGILGVSFYDTMEHRFTYHLGREFSCACDTLLCNPYKGNSDESGTQQH